MKTNLLRFERIVEELIEDTNGSCCESSVFIGEINGRAVRLSVMTRAEAFDQHGFEGLVEDFKCIE